MAGRPPVFAALAARVRTMIAAGDFPLGLPPERELADRLGVARLTLRKALAQLDAEGIHLPRRAARGSAGALLWVGDDQGHVLSEVVAAVAAEAQTRGRALRRLALGEGVGWTTGLAAELRSAAEAVDAIIVQQGYQDQVLANLPTTKPVVLVGLFGVNQVRTPMHHVVADRLRAAQLAVEILVKDGVNRIGLACFGEHGEPWRHDEPYAGWLSATAAWQCLPGPVLAMRPDMVGWEEAFHTWLATERPAAVLLGSDNFAGPCLAAAVRLGLTVPDDLTLVGLGNTPWATDCRPLLTSVSFAPAAMGRLAVTLACEARPDRPTVWRAAPYVVLRRSHRRPLR
jgi:DNA-binding LacI/PurR family transcriptional regulator